MHFSAVLLPLVAALAAASEQPDVAKPLPRLPGGVSFAHDLRRDAADLSRRTDVDPELVCGSNFVDCNNGFCCSSGEKCAGELYGYPVCSDPTNTDGILQGTAAATPYKNIEGVLSSLTAALESLTGSPSVTGSPSASATGAVSSDATTTKASDATKSAAQETGSGSQPTGAASLSVQGGLGSVGMVAMVWGVAVLGGAGWLLA
ncbi:hypothetical protein K491DRAFT_696648 [Lophiostoma macrostomum CBS 122681]|uniref:GPI anchored protein n=1 Tax=Lophiostoma macrostomum CBS 122681 TaxID=1314788 RepID=A0A6A6SXP0_9PLEO|nr:hypothetical protein K491DRAFT_696648 [Lophiostoma macrostomum CBS 122681]